MYLGLAFPSAKDPAWGDEKAGGQPELASVSTAVVIAEVPTGWFDGWAATRVHARGGGYARLKEALEKKMLDALLSSYPQLKGRVKHVSSGTPLSTKHYLRKAHGESYGLKPTPALFRSQEEWLQPSPGRGAVPGLYLA